MEDETKRRPYVIDFYEEPRGAFYKPDWAHGGQIAVLINRAHPFFQTLYSPLIGLPHGGQAKQALDVLLIALARAELAIEDETCAAWYEDSGSVFGVPSSMTRTRCSSSRLPRSTRRPPKRRVLKRQ